MRPTIILCLFALAARAGASSHKGDPRLACLLSRPLIVGASMSAGFKAEDPGSLLAHETSSGTLVTNRAVPHATSKQALARVREGDIESSSLVIGLDLFFWDTFSPDCAEAVARVRSLALDLERKRARAAFGNIPVQGGRCSEAVSKAIATSCPPERCALVDMRGLSLKAAREGGLTLGGRFVPRDELYADDLHPTEMGSRVIATGLAEALASSKMSCQ